MDKNLNPFNLLYTITKSGHKRAKIKYCSLNHGFVWGRYMMCQVWGIFQVKCILNWNLFVVCCWFTTNIFRFFSQFVKLKKKKKYCTIFTLFMGRVRVLMIKKRNNNFKNVFKHACQFLSVFILVSYHFEKPLHHFQEPFKWNDSCGATKHHYVFGEPHHIMELRQQY